MGFLLKAYGLTTLQLDKIFQVGHYSYYTGLDDYLSMLQFTTLGYCYTVVKQGYDYKLNSFLVEIFIV